MREEITVCVCVLWTRAFHFSVCVCVYILSDEAAGWDSWRAALHHTVWGVADLPRRRQVTSSPPETQTSKKEGAAWRRVPIGLTDSSP